MEPEIGCYRLLESVIDAYNAKGAAAFLGLLSVHAEYWSVAAGEIQGARAITDEFVGMFETHPTEQWTVLRKVADESNVVAEILAQGTNDDNEPYGFELALVIRVDGGEIGSLKLYFDPEDVPGLA